MHYASYLRLVLRTVTTAAEITVESCPRTDEAPLGIVGAHHSPGTVVGRVDELAGTVVCGDELELRCDEDDFDGGRMEGPEII